MTTDLSAAELEALAWVDRLTSGDATERDLTDFKTWRAQGPAHSEAFTGAVRLRRLVATRETGAFQSRAPAAARGTPISRRAALGGVVSMSLGAYLLARPPLGLWPSFAELNADYRTAKGERRQVRLAGARIDLNTQTAVATVDGGVRLISGELVADTSGDRSFAIRAGSGIARSRGARVNVLDTGEEICVTCLSGGVRVEHTAGTARQLRGGELVRYTASALGEPETADVIRVAAWRRGLLIFHDEPLSGVVAEVNRYRSGRIVLTDAAIGRRTFNGVFRIDHIDDVVAQIRSVAKVRQTDLPGGVLLLG